MHTVPAASDTPDQDVTGQADTIASPTPPDPLIDDELLIEEISIDGMCGVY